MLPPGSQTLHFVLVVLDDSSAVVRRLRAVQERSGVDGSSSDPFCRAGKTRGESCRPGCDDLLVAGDPGVGPHDGLLYRADRQGLLGTYRGVVLDRLRQ